MKTISTVERLSLPVVLFSALVAMGIIGSIAHSGIQKSGASRVPAFIQQEEDKPHYIYSDPSHIV